MASVVIPMIVATIIGGGLAFGIDTIAEKIEEKSNNLKD